MDDLYEIDSVVWKGDRIMNASFTCGYCGMHVTSDKGMSLNTVYTSNANHNNISQGVYICTNCHMPTFIYNDVQVPGVNFGNFVNNIPEEVGKVYEEARKSFSVQAYTAVVLLCRKLLMHVSVDLGANENKRFIEYVDYLKENHYVPKNSEGWIDAIRKFGNKSTHDIVINTKEDAEKMIKFSEMLLKMNYEYPALMNQESDSTEETNS
ncbi:DUF4145 domain-containing protein [Leuconostoc mesenteroides]|uniref:DUF4145 domain-containing protein n=1 Tax=Leuconostoc mesenteroides TaxID=1245 RepID=UPI002360067F|nr:DUF4145 domain-containing protein [Leuconostoc mesenteroides]